MNVDERISQKYKEILIKYQNELMSHGFNSNSDIKEVLDSDCSLYVKSIFCLYKLIDNIPNGEVRPQQIVMITEMSCDINDTCDGLIQAGTGVGKSIAYLIPAIISGKKCFISTSTKQLTSQLTEKDLPLLKKYLFPDLEFSGLQSLSNFICPRKLIALRDEAGKSEASFVMTRDKEELNAVKKALTFYESYINGNLTQDELTVDRIGCNCESFQCAGSTCTRNCGFEGKEMCPVYRIVGKVMRSQIVVTNHAYISNMLVRASKEEGKDLGILKGRTLWICDEAHDLENYLEKAFSTEISYDTIDLNYMQKLQKYHDSDALVATFKNEYEKYHSIMMKSNNISEDIIYQSSSDLVNDVASIYRIAYSVRELLDRYKRDAEFYLEDMNKGKTKNLVKSVEKEIKFTEKDIKDIRSGIEGLITIKPKLETLGCAEVKYVPTITKILNELLESLRVLNLAYSNEEDYISYYNYIMGNNTVLFTLSSTYLKLGDALQAALGYLDLEKSNLTTVNNNKINIIGVSATLCIGNEFKDTADKFGMDKLKGIPCYSEDVGTVFDYEKQGLLYAPKDIPDVKAHREEQFAYFKSNVVKLIDASKGGALILCTTNSETKQTAEYLSQIYAGKYNVLSSSLDTWKNKSKNDMVKAFREDENSILVGTRGFFQGLDVQGDSLRLLCLNKLPFGSPGVVSKRKMEIAVSKGQDGYRVTAIVPTTMLLLQAIGRLIRHTEDRGVVAIFDNRLYSGKGWLSPLINSIPPFKIVDDVTDVEEFFNN